MMRLVLIHTARSTVREAFEPALSGMASPDTLTVLEAAPRAPLRLLRHLLAVRPHIVVAEAGAPHLLAATLYRRLHPGSRLVLCASGAKLPPRLTLHRADAVVTDPAELRRVCERLRGQVARQAMAPALPDLELFRCAPVLRGDDAAHRLLFVGDLSAASLASDLLIALAGWAEAHPQRSAEIWWAGDGDLSGVLAAQPLPSNLLQQFHGAVTRPKLAELMARCGLLVASAELPKETAPIVEALAAGLVIVASRRLTSARLLLHPAGPGWLFDTSRQNGLAETLDQVMACDPARLDELREQGRRLACGPALQDVTRPMIADTLAQGSLVGHGALT